MSRTGHSQVEGAPPREGVKFGPFCLTLTPLQLWRGKKKIALQPRPLAVLRYLVEHPETIVSNDTLRQAVWARTVVSSTSVQVCLRQVRKALGDETSTPRYIETVGREGYRFIAQLSTTQPVASIDKVEVGKRQQLATRLVGRDSELARLHALLAKALTGERQLVFLTGEAGIGKTTLIDVFLQQIKEAGDWRLETGSSASQASSHKPPISGPWVGRGQCLEHAGEGEAYLSVLEAVGHLCQRPDSADFLRVLRRYAPTWLLHLPGVVEPEDRELLQRQGAGATQSQMLREMAEALEAGSADRLVILVLEDLHVSDPSTVELVAYLAQRRGRARLLLIGSYRPIDMILSEHPLRGRLQELLALGSGQTLALELWTEAEVAAYLCRRLATATLPGSLARWVAAQTDGNALFVTHMVEYLLEQQRLTREEGHWRLSGDLTADVVPDTLQRLILAQFHSLPSEQQQVLEAASIVGPVFSAASVAAALQRLPEVIEENCDRLVQHGQFLRELGVATWPDGTVNSQYGFRHALYPEVLYQRMSAGRRVRMHRAIGLCEELGYGAQAGERAAELARHFTQGHDIPRAVQYLLQAGQNALRLSAHVEALSRFTQGLTLLTAQPETPERTQQEVGLQIGVGVAQMATKGFAAPEVERAFVRAHLLCQQIGDTPDLFHVLIGLWAFYFTRGELLTARTLAERLLRLAHTADSPALLAVAHGNLQFTLYSQGELTAARVHGEQALTQFAALPPLPLVFSYGPDPAVRAQSCAATTLHALGYLDQAWQQSRAALAAAQELGHSQTLAAALQVIAGLHGACQEWAEMQARAAELIALAVAHGLPFWWAVGQCNHGIALAQQGNATEGINQIRQGLAIYRAAGATVGIPRILGWLAEACGRVGEIDEGFLVLEEAFAVVKRNDERIWEGELYRRKGELTLRKLSVLLLHPPSPNTQHSTLGTQAEKEAEAYFLKAIDIARQQHAKSFELRAMISLSRMWQRQHKVVEARRMLAEVYGWFTERCETADLQEAKALLEALNG